MPRISYIHKKIIIFFIKVKLEKNKLTASTL